MRKVPTLAATAITLSVGFAQPAPADVLYMRMGDKEISKVFPPPEKRSAKAPSTPATNAAGASDGVPPPKYTDATASPSKTGARHTSSERIAASNAVHGGGAEPTTWILKSQ